MYVYRFYAYVEGRLRNKDEIVVSECEVEKTSQETVMCPASENVGAVGCWVDK